MIRVDRGKEVKPGIFEYSVTGLGIQGRSPQPLLDACRQLQRILGPTSERAGLFREGRSGPDISYRVDKGAQLTVREDRRKGPLFEKFKPFDHQITATTAVTATAMIFRAAEDAENADRSE
jgi:hypothetical protein